MPTKIAINQRVRELIVALGFGDNVEAFHKRYFGEGRSERLRNVLKDANLIKTDFLVEIAEKIAQIDGKRINLNWVLTGVGEMFYTESDLATKQLLIDTQRELINEYKRTIAKLEAEKADLLAKLTSNLNT